MKSIFRPHSHDATDSVDSALEASAEGIRAVKISLVALGITAVLQLLAVIYTGSVALLADTIHNFSDALTAVPLWIAFVLGRRAASRRYTYGYGRAEDLAGVFIVLMIAMSSVLAGYESIRRLLDPRPITHVGMVIVAGIIGFTGNEIVAGYRIRVGRKIGSAALIADGLHARTDGFTSLAVVIGALGVLAGFPLADPIVGIVITVAILFVLRGAVTDIGRRLMDAVDPALVDTAEISLRSVPGVRDVETLQLRWVGHRMRAEAAVLVDPEITVVDRPRDRCRRPPPATTRRASPHRRQRPRLPRRPPRRRATSKPLSSPRPARPRLIWLPWVEITCPPRDRSGRRVARCRSPCPPARARHTARPWLPCPTIRYPAGAGGPS